MTSKPVRTAAVLAALATTAALAQSPAPAGDAQARWWAHVTTLADDALEGRQTGSEGYRKAVEYVVAQFEQAGLKPAGTAGYLQRVAFSERRIAEDRSRIALVRNGREDVLRFGDDVTVNLRAGLAPSVEAPMAFVGYGLSAPETGHDDLAGIDLKGKVAVYLAGTAAITGALTAHYQQAGVRWQALEKAGAIGSIVIPNPRLSEQPWEQTSGRRAEPGHDAGQSPLQRPGQHAGRPGGESGKRRQTAGGLRAHAGGAAGRCRRAPDAAAFPRSTGCCAPGSPSRRPRCRPTTWRRCCPAAIRPWPASTSC